MPHPIYSLLRRLPPDDPSSDAALLARFALQQDQTAFELLVWRYGGLVLGACKRVLRDEHAAEDAFQATFLVLARKAGSVRGSLAGWLHQVARRVCLRALKRNPVPLEPGSEIGVLDPDPLLSCELRGILDEEIARLPEKQRLAVLLCYLQGRSTDDAAKVLGIPRGTVLSRLDAARKRLHAALTRRGVAVPVTLLATGIAVPELTADVCRRVTTSALDYVTGSLAATLPTQLAHEVMHMSARKTVLGMAAVLVLTAGVGTGVGLVMAQGEKRAEKVADKPREEQKAEPAKARADDRLEEDKRQQQRDERLKRLSVWQQEMTGQIVVQEQKRLESVKDAGADVDPAALQAKLGEIDKNILSYEDSAARNEYDIKQAEKRLEDMKAGKFDKTEMYQTIVANYAETEEVHRARTKLSQRENVLEEVKKKVGAGSPALKELEEAVKAAEVELKTVHDQAKTKGEPLYQQHLKRETEDRIKKERDLLAFAKIRLTELRAKRVELVVRIQKAKSAQSAQQLIDDEIQVLRDIRKQVMRERLMLEMGLDEKK